MMKKILISFAVLLAVLLIVAEIYGYYYVHSAAGSAREEVTVEVRPGASFHSIAKTLNEKEVIDSRKKFYLYAKLKGALQSIKAGEYLFDPGVTPEEILRKLRKGSVIKYRLTIPEGYNLYQIAELLDKKGLVSRTEFISIAFDKKLMKKLGVEGVSLEGYLYPETYFFVKGMSCEEIISAMVGRLIDILPEDIEKRAAEIGFTVKDVINLASIIEKETANPDERSLISGVFHNRLKKPMRLQTDPTVIYGMIGRFDGDLKKKDLKKKTPYNTYRINGLPLGPIANPGIDSIKAALSPADVDYIYFVSMNNGSHVFARTLKEHNRNVWKYQKRRNR